MRLAGEVAVTLDPAARTDPQRVERFCREHGLAAAEPLPDHLER